MRSKVHVLLVDDRSDSPIIKAIKEEIVNIFLKKGYKCEVEIISTHSEVIQRLSKKKRIDIIITDFNLFDKENEIENGVDLLIKTRNLEYFKQHVAIYTKGMNKNGILNIKNAIIEKMLKDTTNFTNFSLFLADEIVNYSKDLEKIVDIYLSRWKELNALRGILAKIHAELESKLIEILNLEQIAYKDLIDKFKKEINNNSTNDIFDKWHESRKLRNKCIHSIEYLDHEKGYYISLDKNERIYESDILEKRKEILKDFKIFEDLINKFGKRRR